MRGMIGWMAAQDLERTPQKLRYGCKRRGMEWPLTFFHRTERVMSSITCASADARWLVQMARSARTCRRLVAFDVTDRGVSPFRGYSRPVLMKP